MPSIFQRHVPRQIRRTNSQKLSWRAVKLTLPWDKVIKCKFSSLNFCRRIPAFPLAKIGQGLAKVRLISATVRLKLAFKGGFCFTVKVPRVYTKTKLSPPGQTGHSLLNCTVKLQCVPLVPGTIVSRGASDKCLYVLCLLVDCSLLMIKGNSVRMIASSECHRTSPTHELPFS